MAWCQWLVKEGPVASGMISEITTDKAAFSCLRRRTGALVENVQPGASVRSAMSCAYSK